MDSNDSHLTADDDIIVTKTIRSISGRVLISVLIWKCPRDIDIYGMNSFLVSNLDPGQRGFNLLLVFVPQNEVNQTLTPPYPAQYSSKRNGNTISALPQHSTEEGMEREH